MGTDWIKKRMKVEANWELFPGGPSIVQALAKKEIDIGYIGLPPVIIGIDRGIPIKCVAGGHVECTILVAKDSFKSLEELKGDINATFQQFSGKIIGMPQKGSIHDVIIRNIIKKIGLENEITIKNFDWTDFALR